MIKFRLERKNGFTKTKTFIFKEGELLFVGSSKEFNPTAYKSIAKYIVAQTKIGYSIYIEEDS